MQMSHMCHTAHACTAQQRATADHTYFAMDKTVCCQSDDLHDKLTVGCVSLQHRRTVACAVWPSCHRNSSVRTKGRVRISHRCTLAH